MRRSALCQKATFGFHFSRDGLTVAKATIEKFVARATRLYEQDRKEPSGPSRLGMYVRRWIGWADVGHGGRPRPARLAFR